MIPGIILLFQGKDDWKKAASVYDFTYTDIDGKQQSMDRYR